MSGIAEVFLNQGYRVSGSDLAESDSTHRLQSLGVRIHIGHHAENIAGAQVVIISSAVRSTNPEVVEAKRNRIPVIPRAEMLGELMRGKIGIAVAGTHGKTTTTSMLATVLTEAGLDPTLVIGGKVDSLGGNAKLGQGDLVVAEADESDGSFLHLPATYGIITNIDNDHLDHFGSLTAIEEVFAEFIGQLPFYGLAAVCAEDGGVRRCMSRWTKPIVTYGFDNQTPGEEWDFVARDVKSHGMGSRFTVWARQPQGKLLELGAAEIHVPGRHNVLNAMASVAIAHKLGVEFEKIAAGLAAYWGVKRRFEIRWQAADGKRVIVEDYGHHPTEIAATLAAARSYWAHRVMTVFQPHRYSRTLHCRDGFLTAFRDADVVCITDIYSAGEDPIEGVTGEALARDLQKSALPGQEIIYVGGMEQAQQAIQSRFTDGDLVICMGAGSITRLPEKLMIALGAGSPSK